MNQNIRAAMDIMSQEIRMVGYQVLDTVIPDPITDRGSDTITFMGDVDSDIITVTETDAVASATSLSVNLSDNGDYIAESDYIYISDGIRSEFIQVVQGAGGDKPFSTSGEPDTINLNSGLVNNYAAGSRIQTVETVTYHLDGTTLHRNKQPVAENIESLNLTYGADTVTIQLTARTSKTDPGYSGDGYRRKTMASTVKLRNL